MATKAKKKKKKKAKRPTDVNELAHFLGERSIQESATVNGDVPSRSEISRVMSALGRKGGKIGGRKRAEALNPEQRREIALRAARARWDK